MTRRMSSDAEPAASPAGEAATHSVARARFVGQAVFNLIVTQLPGHWLRQLWLRGLGVRIGEGSMIFRGVTVFGADGLRLGCRVQIGFRVVLDARGGITIGDDVNISSDSQLLTAKHDVHSADFERQVDAIVLESHSWVATRALVLAGVTLHPGAIVAAGSVATRDVAANTIVAGIPAKPIGERRSDLTYRLGGRRPPLY
jgi:putative colanic acid biosynthesis acetyltransferase WcaF